MRNWLLTLVLLTACSNRGLDPAGDGGVGKDSGLNNDGSVAADLKGVTCGDISAAVDGWLKSHLACTQDRDCDVISTACGLSGSCGTFANQGAKGPYLQSLLEGWSKSCAPSEPCACPADLGLAGCNQGVCGPKMFGPGAVGDKCSSGGDCQLGDCLLPTEIPGFTDGYCTFRDCDLVNTIVCPADSACVKRDNGHAYCLKRCNPCSQMVQCRSGYACVRSRTPAPTPWRS